MTGVLSADIGKMVDGGTVGRWDDDQGQSGFWLFIKYRVRHRCHVSVTSLGNGTSAVNPKSQGEV